MELSAKIKYKLLATGGTQRQIEETLNGLGEDGWLVCGVTNRHIILMKTDCVLAFVEPDGSAPDIKSSGPTPKEDIPVDWRKLQCHTHRLAKAVALDTTGPSDNQSPPAPGSLGLPKLQAHGEATVIRAADKVSPELSAVPSER
jgi:hypothetical protein